MISVTRCCLAISRPWVCCHSRNQDPECFHKYPCKVPFSKSQQFSVVRHASSRGLQMYHLIGIKCPIHKLGFGPSSWKTFVMPANMEEEPSSISQEQYQDPNGEFFPEDNSIQILTQKFEADELKSLLADSERTRVTSKLSEANRHNRFLKRQLQIKEDALVDCKSELAALELELQTLIGLAEEMAQSHIPQGWRKINGKYVPSHLLSRLEAFQAKLKEQVKGVDAAKYEDVELLWFGMAEVVQVMGSFDGWSQGEHMSPEYTGGFTKFSATLKLRPGRYEIKFLVDGEWQLSPELPITGEGLMQNNLLIVE